MRIDEVRLTPVWVNPRHLVSTARIVMAGHRMPVIGVVEGNRFVGVLRAESLEGRPESETVQDAVEQPDVVLDAAMRVEDAAELFVQRDCTVAPVVDGERFLGIVTSNMLLRELRRSRDPLTGLPWSDRLREWGVEQLRLGHEITILFVDLDGFGLYNKRYGHVVGDRVLEQFAQCLRSKIDPERDLLVRYGGDEFAIGTLRTRQEVSQLLSIVALGRVAFDVGQPIEPVAYSVGVSGGRRTVERENIHYAATVDNLINLASKDCTRRKSPQPPAQAVVEQVPEPTPPQPPRPAASSDKPTIASIHDGRAQGGSLTTVILAMGDVVRSGVDNRGDDPVADSVARATLQAMERLAGERVKFRLDSVLHSETAQGLRLATVVGSVTAGSEEAAITGTASVRDDLLEAVAKAAIDAAWPHVQASRV
ncbi:MAG: diguanylate cyclase [Fimbriimonadales bacterium]|nr:diguanylate cyclase [Fimbriimonadales bacterium]